MKLLTLTLLSIFFSRALTADIYDFAESELPPVSIVPLADFSSLAEKARNARKIIMIEASASYCEFCHLLEEEIIKPMIRSGDYDDVFIRQIEIDSYTDITDLSGETVTHAEFASQYNIRITPTLIFLDGNGKEVSPRILGVNSVELFGGYVDQALEDGLQKIRRTSP